MRNRKAQEGVAMITVMMIVVVLSLLMVASVNYAMQAEPQSRRDQDWNAALAAAQAGVDDYLYRLQQDDEYIQYSATNPPTPANVAFTGWHDIPGAANEGEFHYSATNLASQGSSRWSRPAGRGGCSGPSGPACAARASSTTCT